MEASGELGRSEINVCKKELEAEPWFYVTS